MTVHVGEVASTVEVAPATPTGRRFDNEEHPLSPTWQELDRCRLISELHAEVWARTAGTGFDA
jgi:hypothetical protein